METITPTKSIQRIEQLDLYRGFAILGIFMVNILVMNISFVYRGEWELEQTAWWSSIAFFILEHVFYAKFFVIFSLLFGMGVMLQYQKVKNNGSYRRDFFVRRFLSLFLFGVAHIVFIWSGDILHMYGLLGFSLLLFFKGSTRFLLIASIVFFAFPFYGLILNTIVGWFDYDYMAPLASYSAEELVQLKHSGSYLSGIQLRIKEFSFALGIMYSGMLPVSISMMLLGAYLIRKNIFNTYEHWLQRIKVPLFLSILVLLIYRFTVLYYIVPNYQIEHGSALSIFLMTLFQLSDVSISFFLLWILGYFWSKGWLKKLLTGIQFIGRMAFTNYIMQSVIAYLIMRTFNGYGTFSVIDCILIVLFTYGIQMLISQWWLRRFKFGPLEWLWRCISYWNWLPMK